MAGGGRLFFKGVRLGYVYEDELHGVLSKYVAKKVEAAGGELLELTPESQVQCTHVLASHCKQELAQWAEQKGKAVVTLLWLYDCLNSDSLLPLKSEPLYNGKIEWRPRSSRGLCAAMTGYSEFIKHVYARMIEGLGLTFTKSMEPSTTNYLIAVDVSDDTSKKIVAARRAPNTIHVVNVLWLYDSLRQGSILPAGPYEGNPPAGMDPAKGAPAIGASPQVIANSDSEGPSDTAHEPASETAAVGQHTPAQPISAVNMAAGVSLLQPEAGTALAGTGIGSARQASRDQCRRKARPSAAASKAAPSPKDRAPEAAERSTAAPVHARGGRTSPGPQPAAQPPPPAVEALTPCDHAGSLGSYRDMSQQVAQAENAVTMLVDQLIPAEPEAPRAELGQDTPSAKAPGGRDGNLSPKLPSDDRGDRHRGILRGSAEAPDQNPFWNASGDKASKGKENGVPKESWPPPQQSSRNIPVNGEAPLASQPAGEEDLGAVSVGAKLPAAERAARKQEGRRGVLWKAAPLKRVEHSKGVKRKGCTEELVGRLVKKDFEEGVFKGRVASFDGETKYYRVEYEDEDSEELSLSELEPILLPSRVGGPAADGPPLMGLGKRPRMDGSKPAAEERLREGGPEAPHPPSSGATRKPLPRAHPRKRMYQNAGGSRTAANRERRDSPAEHQRASEPATRKKQDLPGSKGPSEERGAGLGSTSKRSLLDRRPVVTVSGMHTKQREQAAATLKSLGVGFSSNILSHKWDLRCTHVVLDKGWKRGAKVLSAMAAGAWVLSEKYLHACSAARKLLEEDDFEAAGGRSNISSGAPKHWRLRRKLLDKAAFSGLKAVVYGEFEDGQKPCKEEVVSILQAGDATLLTVNQALHVGAHLVVTKPSRPATDAKIKQLVNAGLCIVSPTFVLDWVAHPWKMASKEHVLFRTRMGADLTRAARERGEVPGGQGVGAGSGTLRADAEANGEVSQAC